MSVRERDYLKGSGDAPAAPGRPSWLARVNEYGEKHATAIITLSTGLIILTVLIFAKYFYDQAQAERAESELAQAETVEKLLELKTRFGATPAAPRIVFRLANRYYEDGRLDSARNEYLHFLERWPGDPALGRHVTRALASLERNRKFEEEQKQARLKEHRLQTHPRQLPDLKDPRLQWGPLPPEPNPTVELDLAGGSVAVELFGQDAPKAVASFVKLAGAKYFDGVKWDLVRDGERLETQPKAEGATDETTPYEATPRPGEVGSLVLLRKDGGDNLAGRFQVLLKAVPELKDATVFGIVKTNLPTLQAAKKDDPIRSVRVTSNPAP